MKKYIILSLSFIAGILVVLNLTAFKNAEKQEVPYKYIMVEVYEVAAYSDKGVHIHYGNGKTEVVPFKEMKQENHDDNGEIILNAINKLGAKGYHITHITSGLANTGMITKIFMTNREPAQ